MNPLDRTAIEDLILNSTHRETADSGGQSLRLAVEVAIPDVLDDFTAGYQVRSVQEKKLQ